MFQLPVIVVLLISMFVGSVSPVLQQEGHNGKLDAVDLKNTTAILVNNSTEGTPPIKPTNDTKDIESANATNNSMTLKTPSSMNVSTLTRGDKKIKNKKQDCNSTKEEDDMLECLVTPHDDDENIEQNTTLNSSESTANTTVATSSKTEATTESLILNVPPREDKEENSGKHTEASKNDTQTIHRVSDDAVPAETNHTVDTNNTDSSTTSKHDLDGNEATVDAVSPLLEDKVEGSMDSENVGAVKSIDHVDDNKHMPSGIIALVTAISFAVAIALVYIGMIVWRRYIEYRYGHRELLVNELEFDTNDLRHFEL